MLRERPLLGDVPFARSREVGDVSDGGRCDHTFRRGCARLALRVAVEQRTSDTGAVMPNLNPVSWLVWALAALAIALVERNPFSQGLLLLIVFGTWIVVGGRNKWWRFAIPLAAVPVLF